MSASVAEMIEALSEKVRAARHDGLFGFGDDDTLADALDAGPKVAAHHFIIALSLLEQADQHLKLAAVLHNEGSR